MVRADAFAVIPVLLVFVPGELPPDPGNQFRLPQSITAVVRADMNLQELSRERLNSTNIGILPGLDATAPLPRMTLSCACPECRLATGRIRPDRLRSGHILAVDGHDSPSSDALQTPVCSLAGSIGDMRGMIGAGAGTTLV